MGKRSLVFLLCLLFAASFAVPASAKIGFELRAGGLMISPTDFNKDFSNALNYAYFNATTGKPDLATSSLDQNLAHMFDGGVNIKVFLGDSLALVLRGDILQTEYDNTVGIFNTNLNQSINCLYNDVAITSGYFGAGLAYYMNLSPNFSFFLSGDGGMLMQFDSFMEVGSSNDVPNATDTLALYGLPTNIQGLASFDSSGFGGHIELGLQLLLNDAIGISLHGGYQILSIPITYPTDSKDLQTAPFNMTDPVTGDKLFKATSINLSGPYFGGGIVLYFGGGSTGAAAASAAGGVSKYEQYGDYYYKQKNYAYAVRYYAGALKTAPNAGLYKKIGFSYYYLKDTAKAMYYLKEYVKQNPNDDSIRKWLGL
jgi:tetratricopeptide (TPR) repeat protein